MVIFLAQDNNAVIVKEGGGKGTVVGRGGMWNGNEMTMKHKTCHSLLKNYKISVEFATAIVKNFLPRRVEVAV